MNEDSSRLPAGTHTTFITICTFSIEDFVSRIFI